jgi:hypothetical protein
MAVRLFLQKSANCEINIEFYRTIDKLFNVGKCPSSIFLPFELLVLFCPATRVKKTNAALSRYFNENIDTMI